MEVNMLILLQAPTYGVSIFQLKFIQICDLEIFLYIMLYYNPKTNLFQLKTFFPYH